MMKKLLLLAAAAWRAWLWRGQAAAGPVHAELTLFAYIVIMVVTMVMNVVGMAVSMGMVMAGVSVLRRERHGGCRDHGNVIT